MNEGKEALKAPVLDLNNEDFLKLLYDRIETDLTNYQEIAGVGENITEAISIIEGRKAYVIQMFEANGFELPTEEKSRGKAA